MLPTPVHLLQHPQFWGCRGFPSPVHLHQPPQCGGGRQVLPLHLSTCCSLLSAGGAGTSPIPVQTLLASLCQSLCSHISDYPFPLLQGSSSQNIGNSGEVSQRYFLLVFLGDPCLIGSRFFFFFIFIFWKSQGGKILCYLGRDRSYTSHKGMHL